MFKKLSALCICFPLAACGINAQEQEAPKETKPPIPEKKPDAVYNLGGENWAIMEFTPEANPNITCMIVADVAVFGADTSAPVCFDKPQPVQP